MFRRISRVLGIFVIYFLFSGPVEARENVTDWYIQDFRAEFSLASDSTMIVTEWITADCGDAPDKHGIFRVVPTQTRTKNETIKTPVELISITDFEGKAYKFTEIKNRSDATLTWKIGDPDKTVTGVNRYKIVYAIKNVIRSADTFDEFYWNIGGNFWELEIDNFQTTVTVPLNVSKDEIGVSVYAGPLGSKDTNITQSEWKTDQTLFLQSSRPLAAGEGVTLSLTFPKSRFALYQFSIWERFGSILWFLIPGIIFFVSYRIWRRHGDDVTWDKPLIAEYETPKGLDMLEIGMLLSNGTLQNRYLTAAIIELAIKGAFRIQESTEKILFITSKDYILQKLPATGLILSLHQQLLLDTLFKTGDSIKLSSLKTTFHTVLGPLKKEIVESLSQKGLLEKKGLQYRVGFIVIGVVMAFFAFQLFVMASYIGGGALLLTVLTLIVFGLIMPKRTTLGTETYWKIKGLKHYMETAEKERQRFHEKEGVFEALLPAAILFDMTQEWIKKMRDIYGEEYVAKYHPSWFISPDMSAFNVDSFSSQMQSLSSSIAANAGTTSGSSGSGSSGGGSGGGGGGGW